MIAKLRFLFLFAGLGALGYTLWVYADAAWKRTRETEAFEESRSQPADPVKPSGKATAGRATPGRRAPSRASGQPFRAKLIIPSLGLDTIVENGVSDDVLRYAAGHIPSTALPGQRGNIGIAGHRDTIFRSLRLVRPGDSVTLETPNSGYHYVVDEMAIVDPANTAILRPTPGENTLTLITCYPFHFVGSAPKRFIVTAHEVTDSAAARRPSRP